MKRLIIAICHHILWQLADDASISMDMLDEEYDDVPEELKSVMFDKYEYWQFDKADRKAVFAWIEADDDR